MNNSSTEISASYILAFDIWKFVASISILLTHSYLLFGIDGGKPVVWPCGHFAVELFFLITGFLFAKSVYKDSRPFSSETIGSETWAFLWKKTKTFIHYYIFGFCAVCALRAIHAPREFARNILPLLPMDALLLVETGIPTSVVQGISWYLSAMLLSLLLTYPLFRYRKKLFADWVAPLSAMFLLGLLYDKFQTCAPPFLRRMGGIPAGTVRALAEICLGVFAFRISHLLQGRLDDMLSWQRRILSVLGFLAPTAAFGAIGMMKTTRLSPLLLFLFFLFVSIAGTGVRVLPWNIPTRQANWLSKFGLSLFLTHTAIRLGLLEIARVVPRLKALFAARDSLSVFLTLLLYLSLSAVLAIICMEVCRPFQTPRRTMRRFPV